MNKTLYLVDASIYIFRAYFSLPETLVDRKGKPANAVIGFVQFLSKLTSTASSRYFAIAFDQSLTTSFRNKIYPLYKANRELPPTELSEQLRNCQRFTEAMGLATFASRRYEADDYIGTLARIYRKKRFKIIYVTADKDIIQLMKPSDIFWNYARNEKLTYQNIKKVLGVKPEQVVDFLALSGDSVDNIPGVKGIGVKTAINLLAKYPSLDEIYSHIDQIDRLKIRGARRIQQLLNDYQQQAYMSRKLATIYENVPIKHSISLLKRKAPNHKIIDRLCKQHNFPNQLRGKLRGS